MAMDLLNNPLPVVVTSKNNAEGYAIDMDGNAWDDVLWVVVMKETGEVWFVPNPEIRIMRNWSMGVASPRRKKDD